MGNLKWLLVAVGVLVVAFLVTQSMQSRYTTQTDRVFPEAAGKVHKIALQQRSGELALVRQDTTWAIVGHDSLEIREQRINTFLDQVLPIKRETVMTRKAENWTTFAVDDSTGTHVRLFEASGTLISHAVFGRSTSDWSRNYVRIGENPEVYLTDTSVLYQLNTSPTFWGRVPPPPAADTTAAPPISVTIPEGEGGASDSVSN